MVIIRAAVDRKTHPQQNRVESLYKNRNALEQKAGFTVVVVVAAAVDFIWFVILYFVLYCVLCCFGVINDDDWCSCCCRRLRRGCYEFVNSGNVVDWVTKLIAERLRTDQQSQVFFQLFIDLRYYTAVFFASVIPLHFVCSFNHTQRAQLSFGPFSVSLATSLWFSCRSAASTH